jgi:hypothetical protein
MFPRKHLRPTALLYFQLRSLIWNCQNRRQLTLFGRSSHYPFFLVYENMAAKRDWYRNEVWDDRYDLALSLLEDDSGGSIWPVAVFSWNAAMALILSAEGEHDDARRFSPGALEAASARQTELTCHRDLGLVDGSFAPIIEKLRNIVAKTDLQ